MRPLRMSAFLRPTFIAPLFALMYALVLAQQAQTPLVLVTIGARYAPADLRSFAYSDEGYDGQSVYYIARDGWQAIPYLDAPAYRMQRILLPVLGRIVALGNADALPWALLAVNLIALSAGTWALERLLLARRVGAWMAAGVALSIGMMGAARLTTTETLAYALALLGLWVQQAGRWRVALLAFALAPLAKEIALLFPAALAADSLLRERAWRPALALALAAGLPFAAWQAVLWAQTGTLGIGSGGEGATSFELLPFAGVLRIWTEGSPAIFAALFPILALFVLLPTAWGLWRAYQDARQGAWSLATSLLAAHTLLMAFVPFSTYREILGILRFIIGLQIALVVYAAHKRQLRPLRYSTLWALTMLILIASDAATLGAD